jgi:hypothetical protein
VTLPAGKRITSPLTLVIQCVLVVVAVGLLMDEVWETFFSPPTTVVKLLKLAALGGITGSLCFCILRDRRVTVKGNELLIDSLITRRRVPLQHVKDVYWIQVPDATLTAEAAMVLVQTAERDEETIRFSPRSRAAFEYLVNLVSRENRTKV